MVPKNRDVDAIVIGGGFYGSTIAVYLATRRQLRRVMLVEKEPRLLARASLQNQARAHSGYHYPRSFTTAFRSRVNLPRFVSQWPHAIHRDFVTLYAIARRNSKVSAKQFKRFCGEIGATIRAVEPGLRRLFNPCLIEDVFAVDEYAFDATQLARAAERELAENNVDVILDTQVTKVVRGSTGRLRVRLSGKDGVHEEVSSRHIFNCTYSGLNQLRGAFLGTRAGLKHEITEMALIEAPPALAHVGVTVMDGPFFSTMPFPSRGLHTLSHVRYTPHLSWRDKRGVDPYARLSEYNRETRVDRMQRDVARYMPVIRQARYVESLFEVKTVLTRNEIDDGRPILFEKHALPGFFSVLGGKIDNIYDVIERLDEEPLDG